MNSRQEKTSRKQKKPYVKPEIKQVELRPDEAVLAACKIGTLSAPGNLSSCTSPTPCINAES